VIYHHYQAGCLYLIALQASCATRLDETSWVLSFQTICDRPLRSTWEWYWWGSNGLFAGIGTWVNSPWPSCFDHWSCRQLWLQFQNLDVGFACAIICIGTIGTGMQKCLYPLIPVSEMDEGGPPSWWHHSPAILRGSLKLCLSYCSSGPRLSQARIAFWFKVVMNV